jgi:hypothetical protein
LQFWIVLRQEPGHGIVVRYRSGALRRFGRGSGLPQPVEHLLGGRQCGDLHGGLLRNARFVRTAPGPGAHLTGGRAGHLQRLVQNRPVFDRGGQAFQGDFGLLRSVQVQMLHGAELLAPQAADQTQRFVTIIAGRSHSGSLFDIGSAEGFYGYTFF